MKKQSLISIFVVTLMCLIGLSSHALADPFIEVVPMEHDFGDVDVGASSTTIITISNINGHELVISSTLHHQ